MTFKKKLFLSIDEVKYSVKKTKKNYTKKLIFPVVIRLIFFVTKQKK